MPALNSQTLAMIRRQTAGFLKDTCKIEFETNGASSFMPKPLTVLVANGVACRVIMSRQGTRPSAEQVASQEQIVDEYRLIVPYGTALAVNQIVTVYTDGAGEGTTYQVTGLITERTDENDAQAVIIRARGA
jgi:hypothetical protein